MKKNYNNPEVDGINIDDFVTNMCQLSDLPNLIDRQAQSQEENNTTTEAVNSLANEHLILMQSMWSALNQQRETLDEEYCQILDFFGVIVDWNFSNYYAAYEALTRLTDQNPQSNEFNALMAYFMAYLGKFEPAMYYFKLSLAGVENPRLKGWMPEYVKGFHLTNFDQALVNTEVDRLYTQALVFDSFGATHKALKVLRDLALIEPERLELWRLIAQLSHKVGDYFDSYLAILQLVNNDKLQEEDARLLIMVMGAMSAWTQLSGFCKSLVTDDDQLNKFIKLAEITANEKMASDSKKRQSVSEKSAKVKVNKKASKGKKEPKDKKVKVGVIAGQLLLGQRNAPFLTFLGGVSTTMDKTMYYYGDQKFSPGGSSFEPISSGWNFADIDSKTVKTIIENEAPSLLVDVDQLSIGHAIKDFSKARTVGFAMEESLAEKLGYMGVIGCKHLYPDHANNPRIFIFEHGWHLPVSMLPSKDILNTSLADNIGPIVHISLPGDADFQKIGNVIKQLAQEIKNLNVVFDARFDGGEKAIEHNIYKLELPKHIENRCFIFKDQNAGYATFVAGLSLDISGSVNGAQTYGALCQASPVLCVERDNPQERISLAIMRNDGLNNYIFSSTNDFVDKALDLLSNSKKLKAERAKLISYYLKKNRDEEGFTRAVSLARTLVKANNFLS